MRQAKKIARFIMELILAITIISFILLHVLSSTVLKETYILSSLEKTNYYTKIFDLIEINFENYIQQSGLDEDVLKNIVTKEKVEEDTKKIINSIFDGLNEQVSTKDLEIKLEKNINKSLKNKSLSSEEKKAIDDFIATIADEYKSTISHLEYENQINNTYTKLMKYVKLAEKISVFAIGGSIIILILLNLKRIYKIGVNIGVAFLASGAFLSIVNIYINAKIKVEFLTILNEPISQVIRNISSDILNNILHYGILLVIVGLVLIFVSTVLHNIEKYKKVLKGVPEED